MPEVQTKPADVKPSEAPRGTTANPSNPPASVTPQRDFIPLGPKMKMETPEIPGYICQWFMDHPGRIQQALRAGYEFVTPEEIQLNVFNPANGRTGDGNTNLGASRVSLYGGQDEKGTSVDQYLMKQPRDLYEKHQLVSADRNEKVAKALRGGFDVSGNPNDDGSNRTVGRFDGGRRVKMPELFIPRHLRNNFKSKG